MSRLLTAPSADVLSGWPVEDRERRDFLHRIRTFPEDVAVWRKELCRTVVADRERFPTAPPSPSEARPFVDDGISYLREIARLFAALYGSPDLGNKKNPVDELVYIILSRKTREDAYQATYRKLKAEFRKWDELLDAPRHTVENLVRSGGLSGKKTESLYGALWRLREEFGRCTMSPARKWSDERLEAFLCSLPEIQRKSAYCIMLFSFGRAVLPVDTHVGRVLARLGPYRELGLDLTQLDHKKRQKVLADLVPPNLRGSLHVNLVMHGREVCLARSPRCNKCEIRNFCTYYRQQRAHEAETSEAPTTVDLFCGAGGLSEGFERAGYRVLAALDMNEVALKTFKLNHPSVPDERVLCRDIREIPRGEFKRLVGKTRVDVLIGAPPCQGFSSAGFRSKKSLTGYLPTQDKRNYLYEYMVAVALELKPRLFLMENVPGMKSARQAGLSFMESAARMLQELGGYATDIWRVNASAFGVPQDRLRYFLVAARGLPLPARPEEDYQDLSRSDYDLGALPPVTLGDAIFDLPPEGAGGGVPVSRWEHPVESKRHRRYLKKFNIANGSALLYEHTVRYHNENDLELYSLLQPGEDSVHAIEKHGRDDLMRYRRDVFDDKYARLRNDRPCKTIVAHLAKDGNGFIHPDQTRSLSFREAARVQSFRDSYVFSGSPSDQWIQLGNAVPPLVAEAIARTFRSTLATKKRKK